MGGVSAWWKIHTCVEMMPDDPDGVWSMLDDMTGETNVTIEDCIELCHAYKRIKQ